MAIAVCLNTGLLALAHSGEEAVANQTKAPLSKPDPGSVVWASQCFERFYPDAAHRRAVIAGLAESAREAHRLMPNAWGITLTNDWFRMNLGQVNVFIGGYGPVLLLLERAGAVRIASQVLSQLFSASARESSYVNAPGCDVASVAVDSLGVRYAELREAHFSGMGLVKKRRGYTWPDAHSVGLVQYLIEAGEHVSQPDYLDGFGAMEAPTVSDADTLPDGRPLVEGRRPGSARRLILHQQIEQDTQLTRAAKSEWAARDPLLPCEICGFSFLERYGTSYIEAHHRTPLGALDDGATQATIVDLAGVCANCHRMLHTEQEVTIAALRAHIDATRSGCMRR